MDKLKDRLKQCEPFKQFSDDAFARLLTTVDTRTYQAGDVIISKNRDFDAVHYLISGGIELRTSFFEREELTDADAKALKPLEESAAPGVAVNAASECTIVHFRKAEIQTAQTAPETSSSTSNESSEDEWMERFLLSPLVSHLDAADIGQLLASIKDIPVKRGQLVIKPGVPGDCFYIVKKGLALVQPMGSSNKVIVKLLPGAQFGEEALVAETVRNAKIVMASDGILGRINKEFFNNVIKKSVIVRLPEAELAQAISQTPKHALLDVRLFPEFNASHRDNAKNLPVSKLRANFSKLDKDATYFITPEGAKRSELATFLLRQAGFNAILIDAA